MHNEQLQQHFDNLKLNKTEIAILTKAVEEKLMAERSKDIEDKDGYDDAFSKYLAYTDLLEDLKPYINWVNVIYDLTHDKIEF